MVRPRYVQLTPEGWGAETAEQTTLTSSHGWPTWVSGLVILGLLLRRILAAGLVRRS